jgi:hypothetical protein
MTQEVARFETETRDDYQQSLVQKEQIRAEQEKQLGDLQEEFEGHIADLKKRLAVVTANSARIAKFYEIEQAQRLEEARVYSRTQQEERTNALDATHKKLLGELGEKLRQSTERHQMKMDRIEQEFNEAWRISQDEFDTRMAELQGEKLALMKTNGELDEDLKVLLGRICPECVRKRNQLRLLVEKRDQLHERKVALQAEELDNEEKIGAIFR